MKRILPTLFVYTRPNGIQGSRVLLFAFYLLFSLFAVETHAQQISGQWIGGFTAADDPSNNKTDYVLELELKGTTISGYSYTYFSMSGKRFYVICRVKGNFDASSKSMVINEIETIKTNTPPDFQNCLQHHELTYFKKGNIETLLGKWKPVEKESTCGKGTTSVERKTIAGLKTNPTTTKTGPSSVKQKAEPKLLDKNTNTSKPATSANPVKPETKTAAAGNQATSPLSTEKNILVNPDPKSVSPIESGMARKLTEKEKAKLAERSYQVIQTIEVDAPLIKVEIYDNGQVDGDTVTIYLNEKLLVPAKMLTAKPISIDIKINDKEDIYDLIMYAESLGTIPPNTALMIVTTPRNRYEINITSTEQTSGAVRFKVKR